MSNDSAPRSLELSLGRTAGDKRSRNDEGPAKREEEDDNETAKMMMAGMMFFSACLPDF